MSLPGVGIRVVLPAGSGCSLFRLGKELHVRLAYPLPRALDGFTVDALWAWLDVLQPRRCGCCPGPPGSQCPHPDLTGAGGVVCPSKAMSSSSDGGRWGGGFRASWWVWAPTLSHPPLAASGSRILISSEATLPPSIDQKLAVAVHLQSLSLSVRRTASHRDHWRLVRAGYPPCLP